MRNTELDTVIVGGGIAGLTVAYRLRDRDVLLLEKEEYCGGRTVSRKLGGYVYNAGAQVILGETSLTGLLAKELGVQITLIAKSKTPMHIKGRLVASSSELLFLLKLPIPWRQKLKLGFTIFKLRRRYGNLKEELPDLGDPALTELNASTLAEIVGADDSDLKAIWDTLSLGITSLRSHEVAAYHPLSAFLTVMRSEYFVEGGTWELTKALWRAIEGSIETSAEVTEIRQQDGAVRVAYEKSGRSHMVHARRCVAAIPGPLLLPIVKDLPTWKRDALSSIDYGSFTTAAFLLTEPSERFLPEGVWRVPVVGKRICSVTNPTFTFPRAYKERIGRGLLRVYTGNEVAKGLMRLPDDEALDILEQDLLSVVPGAKGKISDRSIKHWEHAVSPWRPGRFKLVPSLQAPTGRIYYCGDYTDGSAMDGSVHSAYRVLEELREDPS